MFFTMLHLVSKYFCRLDVLCCVCVSTERLWVSSGPVCGGCDAGRLLFDGPAVVRGRDGAVNLPCEQPEAGI